MDKKFPMVAKTFQGLEDVLRDELITLGAENVETGLRMVSFEGNLEMMYRANLSCRTALRILKPIIKFTADNTDELYDMVRELDWEQYLTPEMTFSIDTTVNSREFTHSRYVTYRVKDGIADHFNDSCGRRPSIRLKGADVQLNVHIDDNRITISLDSSGEPLSHRGYRIAQTEAPINEVLAAGIILKTGWRGDTDFADPMCGSGTFLIEAALIAGNINPGIYRRNFAFENWKDFDKDLFEEVYNDDSAEREITHKILGGDIDPEAVAIARKNIRSAGMEDKIDLRCASIADWTDNPTNGVMVTNPPYGERLKPDDMTELFKMIGTSLKQNFKGWHAWILGYRDEHMTAIGLKPSVKIPLLNGSLECSLREYVLFDGTYSDFRAGGGSVANTEAHKEKNDSHRMHRLSDEEWKKETRKFGDRTKRYPDKKKNFSDRDRKPAFRKNDRDRKPGREERREEKRPFRKESRPTDRKPARREGVTIVDRGPKLPAESATVINSVHIRSRKNKKTQED